MWLATDDVVELPGPVALFTRPPTVTLTNLNDLPPTFSFMAIDDPADLGRISAAVRDNSDITIHSSHPQGGNAMSKDPRKGVVDENFALHGRSGVYVCDASVFPAPQRCMSSRHSSTGRPARAPSRTTARPPAITIAPA